MNKTIKRFYNFLLERKRAFVTFIFVLVITGIVKNIRPYIYKLLIEKLPSGDYGLILKIVSLYVGIRIAGTLLNVLTSYTGDRVLVPASREARMKIFKKIHDLDFAFHVNKSTGRLISIFKRGDSAFGNLFHSLHMHIYDILVSLVVALFFFSQVTVSIVWLMIAVFFLNTLISWRLIKINLRRRRAFNKEEDAVSGIITDSFLNYETVKYFSQEEKEQKRLRKNFKSWTKKFWSFLNSFRIMDVVVGTLSGLGMLMILWIVVEKTLVGEISVGDLVMVISFTNGFYFAFFELLYSLRRIAGHYVDLQKYLSILDNEILIRDPVQPVPVENIKGEIRFKNVSFTYPDGKNKVLKDISFQVKPGKSVAFVGRSGAGKTTIIKLLLRFYDPDEGQILIDSIDISKLNKGQLRSLIGVVPQEPIMFNNTVRFNVSYGNPKTSEGEIIEASKIANIHHLIETLPKKYETIVGERGVKLSAGQKQRLAIARMILARPKIIVFDEATSNLDSESEALIQDALWKIAKNKTVLIIAHRFSTLRKVDKIIVLEKDHIAETGSHEELIKKKGLYSYLWKLQSHRSSEKDLEELLDR